MALSGGLTRRYGRAVRVLRVAGCPHRELGTWTVARSPVAGAALLAGALRFWCESGSVPIAFLVARRARECTQSRLGSDVRGCHQDGYLRNRPLQRMAADARGGWLGRDR